MKGVGQEDVRAHLEELLSSDDFSASQRLKAFLRYIVEKTLAGKGNSLKAYSIAVDVFELGADFDARLNPLVRTEAGRLRSKLDYYYRLHPDSKIQISIPKGGYVANFTPNFNTSESNPGSPEAEANQTKSASPLGEKGTVLLFPIVNVNNAPEVDGLIFGLHKELASELSRFYDLNVIEYIFSQSLKVGIEEEVVKRLVKEYGARFVLYGSIQVEGQSFRVWMTLRDASNKYNIWSEKYDGSIAADNLFKLQDEISEAIIYPIAGESGIIHSILQREYSQNQTTPSLLEEAMLLYTQYNTYLTFESVQRALPVLEEAVERYPENATVLAILADLYTTDYQYRFDTVENALDKSFELASRAVLKAPYSLLAHLTMAFNYYLRNDLDNFLYHAERTLEINPHDSNALGGLAPFYGHFGMWDKFLELFERQTRLNPSHPTWIHDTYAIYHYLRGDNAAALSEVKKTTMKKPTMMALTWNPLVRLGIYGNMGDREGIVSAAAELLQRFPDFWERTDETLNRLTINQEFICKLKKDLNKAEAILGSG